MATLYVGNLPWETTSEDVRALFASCGNVVRAEVPVGRQGRSRGYALVEFSNPVEASGAIQRLSGADLSSTSPQPCLTHCLAQDTALASARSLCGRTTNRRT